MPGTLKIFKMYMVKSRLEKSAAINGRSDRVIIAETAACFKYLL